MPKGKPKSNERKKKKTYLFEFTSTRLLFWSFGFLLLLAWIFVLGIFVGKGLLPGIEKNTEPETSLNYLLGDSKPKQKIPSEPKNDLRDEPELAFYKELSSKKAEAARKTQPTEKKVGVSKQDSNKTPEKQPVSNQKGQYALQLASLQTESKAKELLDKLAEKGFPAYLSRATVKEKTHFRVRCGPYETRDQAIRTKQLLEKDESLGQGFVLKIGNGAE